MCACARPQALTTPNQRAPFECRALQLLADAGCWGLGDAEPPCSVGPLRLLTALCEQHPPALSLALSRLCGGGPLADNCVAALAACDEWAAVPLIGCAAMRAGAGGCLLACCRATLP